MLEWQFNTELHRRWALTVYGNVTCQVAKKKEPLIFTVKIDVSGNFTWEISEFNGIYVSGTNMGIKKKLFNEAPVTAIFLIRWHLGGM